MNRLIIASVTALLAGTAVAGGSHGNKQDCDPVTGQPYVNGQQSQTANGGNSSVNAQTKSAAQSQSLSAAQSTSGATATTGSVGAASTVSGVSGGAGGNAQSNVAANGGAGGEAQAQNAGNSQTSNTTYAAPKIPVASAFATPGMTTSGCRFSDAVGLSTLVAGVSLSKSRADTDCRKVEIANAFYSRGLKIAGDKVTCTVSYVHAALGDDCEALLNEQDDGRVYNPPVYTERDVQERLSKQAAALNGGK